MDFISGFINTLLSYRIDYSTISTENFEHWRFISGIITGCITALIIIFLNLKAYNALAINFKQFYPKERLVYVINNGIFSVFIVNFFLGSSIGFFLIPFLCFKNLDFSPKIFLLAICIIFILHELIVMYTTFYVLSDKQICLFNPYKKFKNSIRRINILYSEIQDVSYKNFSGTERLVLKLKSGKIFDKIAGLAKLKEAKAIIEGKIERQSPQVGHTCLNDIKHTASVIRTLNS